jgi:small subunit ribosomal protein S2
MKADGTFNTLSKKEKLQVDRLRAKLEKNLGSISDMTRLPGALFIVDIRREHIAVKEAQKLNIPIFAMVDTNADPRDVDYVIPANDDASKSIEKIMTLVTEAVAEGLKERQKDKADADAAATEGEVVSSTEPIEAVPAKADKPAEATTEEVAAEEVVEEAKAEKPTEKAEKPAKKKKAAKKADKPAEVVEIEEPAEDAVEDTDEETKEEK